MYLGVLSFNCVGHRPQHVSCANTAGGTRVGPGTARARLGTPGRLNYAECRSDSNSISYLCTLSAAPELGSASTRASEVSVKTLTLTDTPTFQGNTTHYRT